MPQGKEKTFIKQRVSVARSYLTYIYKYREQNLEYPGLKSLKVRQLVALLAHMAIETLVLEVLRREGGYVNHPADRGGPTNMGITQKTLSNWRGHPVTAEDVRLLSQLEARQIYIDRYWHHPRFSLLDLPFGLMDLLFDMAVHHGPTRAVKLLQQAVGVEDDGIIGPVTCSVVRHMEAQHLMALVCGERAEYYGRIITRDPSQAVFAAGWMTRLREFVVQIPLQAKRNS